MCEHEHKHCPRCNIVFECKIGSILLCQCTSVKLNEEELEHMRNQYDDCLCAKCMKEVKGEFHNNRFKEKIKKMFGINYR